MRPSRSGFLRVLPAVAVWLIVALLIPRAEAQIWHEGKGQRAPYMDPAFNEAMTRLVKDTLPAVVSIATSASLRWGGEDPFSFFFRHFGGGPQSPNPRRQGMGSGFLINSEGYILTNNHVIEDADEITVQLHGGEEFKARVVGRDPRIDVALIKVDAERPLPFLSLGDSDRLDIGHMVIAMGNPFGLSFTVTQGIISQKGRKDINPSGRRIYANFIQTDASINPGNSGGPLLNIHGEAIGINTAIAQGQGIGFAIPINMVKQLLPQLAEGRLQRSWLGVSIQEMTPELADSLGMKQSEGVLIVSVAENSPARKAGLQPEDVLLTFNGSKLETPSDLWWLASTSGAGTTVELGIWRGGKSLTLQVKLESLPDSLSDSGGVSEPTSKRTTWAGMRVATPTREQLEQAAISDGRGVLVAQVDPNSPAGMAGIRPGDIIRKINTAHVRNAEHFQSLVSRVPPGGTVRLLINRNQMALFVAFTVPR